MVQKKNARLLTEVELEIMNAVWSLGECTVKEVQGALSSSRDLAYTSVATVMKILEEKKVLSSRKTERAHIFTPLLQRADYESKSLQHITENVFQGSPSSLVTRLLEDTDLTELELKSIRQLLNERLKTR